MPGIVFRCSSSRIPTFDGDPDKAGALVMLLGRPGVGDPHPGSTGGAIAQIRLAGTVGANSTTAEHASSDR
jgi:hypothetical protein